MEPRTPLDRLSKESWLQDFQFLLQASMPGPDIDLLPRKLEDYLGIRYEDIAVQLEAQKKLSAAWMWLHGHIDEMEAAKLMVAGEQGSLLKNELLFALYDLFGFPPEPVSGGVPISAETVIRQARSYLKMGNSAAESQAP